LTVLPGFGRGLALHGGYAYVGLSKPRYDDFAGLPLGERAGRDVPWCGVRIVETRTGVSVGWLRLEPELREVSDVCVLPGPVTYLDAPAARSRRFITIEPSS
jgi:hypothetical protein